MSLVDAGSPVLDLVLDCSRGFPRGQLETHALWLHELNATV
jgi:hypothetical protein